MSPKTLILARPALWLAAALILAGLFVPPARGQSLTPGVDANTVALWPFDEAHYVNMTLTDAGPGQYDLRLRLGGRMVAGRFGNALEISTQSLPACMFAEIGGALENPDLTSRAVDPPLKILDALAGPEWTWECWVKLKQAQTFETALLHLAKAGANTFYCGLTPGAKAVVLRDWSAPAHASLPIQSINIADGGWHHLALIKRAAPAGYELAVDGKSQPAAQPIEAADPGLTGGPIDYSQGLVGLEYAESNLTRPHMVEVNARIDFDYRGAAGTSSSAQWRGVIESPVSGLVTFRAEALWGMRLRVNDKPVIDGWSPDGARKGTVTLTRGVKTPIVLDYAQVKLPNPRLSLYWSWPGHAEELVPPRVLLYSPQDAQAWGAIIKAKPDPLPRAFEMRVGTTIAATRPLNGSVDELRFSKVARALAGGSPPVSYTYNYGPNAPAPSRPDGPPLLFASDVKATAPLPLGGRKHVFIDDALLERKDNLTLAMNPWTRREKLSIFLGGDPSVVDHDGQVRLYTCNGDQWNGGIAEGMHAAQFVYTSSDGLTFDTPQLGFFELNGNKNNSIVVKAPVQGQVFKDPNPAAPAAERFKFTAYYMTRGQYLYYSPDGIHFTRNETLMEPFDCGGGVESFWDDQRGEYFSYIRSEGYHAGATANPESSSRAAALARTREPMKPWPFTPSITPYVAVGLWTMPALGMELPLHIVNDGRGHVYRARPAKYAWAPDVYLNFVWRGGASGPHNPDSGYFWTDLGVSRDGLKWKYYDPGYIEAGKDFDGETIVSAIASMGIIRRGAELWNYGSIRTKTKSGEDGTKGGLFRFTQRLDGYVSLNADDQAGTATTKPFTFAGERLIVNLKAPAGQLRVGLVNADGSPIAGFGLDDCTPLTADSIEVAVNWKSGAKLSDLAGKPVRMQLELRNGKLYAFQFMP